MGLPGRSIIVAVAVACLVLGGCQRDTGSQTDTVAVTRPQTVTVTETTCSPMPYREFILPPGGVVDGYDGSIACLLEPVSAESEVQAVRVLDLETGENARVVDGAVGAADGFEILAARCSEGWLVWEEIAGDEWEQPLGVEWRLYALPLAGCTGVGDPVVVAGTVTSAQSRPLFSVVDDTLYWMTNSFANARQEGAIDQARVWSRQLPDGETRRLYATDGPDAFSFSAQPGELLLTEAVSRDTDEGTLVVLEPGTGLVRERIALNNRSWLSHYTAYRDGACAWSEGTADGGAGDFFYRGADGSIDLVARAANDAVFVGDYLFYEYKPVVSKGAGIRAQRWRVCALDLRSMEYVTVFDEEARALGWVAPIAVAPQEHQYVMYRSVPPWITDEPPGTWVRVYSVE